MVANLESDRLDFVRLKILRIKTVKSASARLPQKADIKLEQKAE